MNIKAYMALAVAALTAACAPSAETQSPSVAEAAGPAAEEALATANATTEVVADNEATPEADSK